MGENVKQRSADTKTGLRAILAGILSFIKRRRLIVLIIVLVLASSATLLIVMQRRPDGLKTSTVCASDDELLRRVNDAFRSADIELLKKEVDDIVTRDNYLGDVNCLTPVLQYKLMGGNAEDINTAHDQLKEAYAQGSKLNNAYDAASYGLEAMGTRVEAQKTQAEIRSKLWNY